MISNSETQIISKCHEKSISGHDESDLGDWPLVCSLACLVGDYADEVISSRVHGDDSG